MLFSIFSLYFLLLLLFSSLNFSSSSFSSSSPFFDSSLVLQTSPISLSSISSSSLSPSSSSSSSSSLLIPSSITSFSISYSLSFLSLPPFIGNKTIFIQKISTLSYKRRPIFILESELPQRNIKFIYYKVNGDNLTCQINEFLSSNQNYSLMILLSYNYNLFSMMIYLNGILKNSCYHYLDENILKLSYTSSNSIFERHSLPTLSLPLPSPSPNNKDKVFVKAVHYWNRLLSYKEVQIVSNTITGSSLPHSNWIYHYLPSLLSSNFNYINNKNLEECEVYLKNTNDGIDGINLEDTQSCQFNPIQKTQIDPITIVLWPSFYSHQYPIHTEEYFSLQLIESIQDLLESISTSTLSSTTILVPILTANELNNTLYTTLLKNLTSFYLSKYTSVTTSEEFINVELKLLSRVFLVPIYAEPYSVRDINSLYLYGNVINSLLHTLYPTLKNKKILNKFNLQTNNIQSISNHIISDLQILDPSFNSEIFYQTYPFLNKVNELQTPVYLSFISSHIYPVTGWLESFLTQLDNNNTKSSIFGGKIVTSTGLLSHYGHELFELPFTGGTEVLLVPHDRYRGYWTNDERTLTNAESLSVSRDFMIVPVSTWNILEGFDVEMSPLLEDSDFCLRAYHEFNISTFSSGYSVGISLLAHHTTIDTINEYTSKLYSPLKLSSLQVDSIRKYSGRWREKERVRREQNYITDAKLTWVIHCGGSQGLEAATILQTLYKYLNVRTLVRRYRICEHSDTLSGMPAFFRDVLEATSLKSFTPPYQGFITPYKACNSTLNISTDCTTEPNYDEMEDNSIVLYARDYREIGRWIPHDTKYLIGRYMYETDGLPLPWVRHLNNIDETWVPSKWQKDMFVSSGAKQEKIQIMHETVDSNFFNPNAVSDLSLPGTVLDGYKRNDPDRPYAFCSVFKMEGRKGWKELVESFMREFQNSTDVVLILRTYIHTGTGISAENFNRAQIRKDIDDHLEWRGLPKSESLTGPRIEIVSDHLTSVQLVTFYKACDAFVLSTHAEGWGLPTHEAMIMGLPVITTNWGGSTEFVTSESGLLINVSGFSQTFGDNWLKGFNWADVSVPHFQQLMRLVYSNRTFSIELGKKGFEYMRKFSPDAIALQYANRIAEINKNILPKVVASDIIPSTSRYSSHGELVASKLDVKWSLSSRFKTCSVRSYKQPFSGNESNYKLYDKNNNELCNIVIISTWAPRMCGIATFSDALRNGLLTVCPEGSRIDIIAVKHKDQPDSEYDENIVKKTFREYEVLDYIETAQFINTQRYHTVLIQYEYGMLYGDNLVCLMRELSVPKVITTLHTVHVNLEEHIHAWVQQVTFLSTKIVVMTHSMRHVLTVYHAIPTRDIIVIPHGGPDFPYIRYDNTELQTLYPTKKVILSNGLIHQMKGIEYVIRAMPRIIQAVPNAVYLVHGRPHPSGTGCEEYYKWIQDLANETGTNAIYFNRSYANNEDLYYMLQNARAYVNAYTDEGQSVSGTLAMALSIGTVTISTPYSYAIEMLHTGAGKLVPFRAVDELADAIISVLKDDDKHEEMSLKAYKNAQLQTWKKVASGYLNI